MKTKKNLEELCPFASICPYHKEGKGNNPERYQYCEQYQEFMRYNYKLKEQK